MIYVLQIPLHLDYTLGSSLFILSMQKLYLTAFTHLHIILFVFYRCSEEDKDAYLYYILSVHGQGRTIIFCTSIAALRHISSILRILGINVLTNHAQMQQRARMKVILFFIQVSFLLISDIC
jgi:superfamily II DNA/RNA helicase